MTSVSTRSATSNPENATGPDGGDDRLSLPACRTTGLDKKSMTCPECENTVDADSRVCKHCGAKPPPPERSARPGASSSREAVAPSTEPTDEKTIWEGRRAWRSYYGVWVLCAAVGISLPVVVYRMTGADSSLRTWAWGVAAAFVLAVAVQETLVVFGRRYRLTNRRLFVERGSLTRIIDQTDFVRVDDVRIRQGIVGRIVDTGDVEVLGSDTTDKSIVFNSIERPAEVAELLLHHVRDLRNRKTLFVEHV